MIIEIIEKHLSKTVDARQEKRNSLHVSDADGCIRKTFLDIKGKVSKESPSAQLLRVYDNGNKVHDRIKSYLKEMKILKAEEVSLFDKELGVTGRYDAKIELNGQELIIEIKSINSYNVNKPLNHHVLQIMYYMHLTGIKRGVILYEAKPNQKLFEFLIDYDEAILNEAKKWFKEVKMFIDSDNLPPIHKDYDKDSYPCSGCGYRKFCYGNNV